jgi:hypothetical protein
MEHNSVWLLACTNDYLPMVWSPIRLLPGGVHSCTTTSWRMFIGWHCFYSSCIKLDQLLQAAQHVGGASSTSPASVYKLELLHLFMVFFVFSYRFNADINNHYHVIILLNNIMIYFMDFGIQIYHKIPNILTPSWRCQFVCARIDNQQSRGVMIVRVRRFVRSLHHQCQNLH